MRYEKLYRCKLRDSKKKSGLKSGESFFTLEQIKRLKEFAHVRNLDSFLRLRLAAPDGEDFLELRNDPFTEPELCNFRSIQFDVYEQLGEKDKKYYPQLAIPLDNIEGWSLNYDENSKRKVSDGSAGKGQLFSKLHFDCSRCAERVFFLQNVCFEIFRPQNSQFNFLLTYVLSQNFSIKTMAQLVFRLGPEFEG